jgi:hypothetical protein
MKNVSILIIFLLLSTTCNFESKDKLCFRKNRKINGEVKSLHNAFLSKPHRILSWDKYAIVIDNVNSKFIKVIDLEQNKLVSEFADMGRGPNEISYFGDAWIDQLNNNLEILDLTNKSIHVYSLRNLEDKDIKPIAKIELESPGEFKRMHYSRIHRLSDSLLISAGILEVGRFALINGIGKYIGPFEDIDIYGEEFSSFSNIENCLALQGKLRGEQNLGKFVFATTKSAFIHFYQYQDQNITSVKNIKYFSAPPIRIENSIATSREIPFAFMDVATSKDFVFALYSGKSVAQHNLNSDECTQIFVYDWKGNPIEEIEIGIPCKIFCYHEKLNSLVGIAEIPEPQIVIYNLAEK